MSLTSALNTATAALMTTQYQLTVASGNISNAGTAGATQKTYTISTPISMGMDLTSGQVTRITDAYLTRSLNSNSPENGRDSVIGSYLTDYDSDLGTVDSGDDLSSLLTSFQTALSALGASPTSDSDKSAAVSAASNLAQSINGLSDTVQSMRTQANSDIGQTVAAVNTSLQTLQSLNAQILAGTNSGADVTGLEDKRDTELTNLSSMVGVTYFTNPSNQVVIYDQGGDQLLGVGNKAASLSYIPSGQLDSAATYPGVISGITINGQDVTGSLQGGKLGGLVQLRDSILPDQQNQLDQLASTLISQVNTVSNAGSAFPPPNTLTSAGDVAASDAFSGTGVVRIAVTSSTGAVVSTADLNLSSYSTVGALMAGINAIGGLTASISASGQLTLTASSSSNGVAINGMTSSVGAGSQSFSSYFGFNNVFSGTDATTIGISPGLATNAMNLPTGTLSNVAGLAVGDNGVSPSDGSTLIALGAALTASTAFAAVGTATAQTNSLQTYTSSFISNAATLISGANAAASSSQSNLTFVQNALSNETGVNVDQQTALLTQYQNEYQAAAQLLSTVKDMFNTLITVMEAT